ncbi:GNAT family N-acetyltransferase [Roseivirga sp. BDSF3-8]|uniref:GNAT family N-acetyltransferase n=1 Tax=Roseivirga sp. BDSF3-8 TaxID=3241598 RepID=UPI00353191A8
MNVKALKGKEAKVRIDEIAALRMEVFREFPYLYEGTVENEEEYLSRYLEATGFMAIVAEDKHQIVGVSTCLPLEQEIDDITAPFVRRNISLDSVLYFGESVLKRSYRGRGLGVRFFDERESYARDMGREACYFCAVERSPDHSLKPAGYRDLQDFWKKRGYEITDLFCTLEWQDIDQDSETEKSLRFWKKEL